MAPMELTASERRILRHALGLDNSANAYRNHYVTSVDVREGLVCQGLCARGLMVDQGIQPTMAGMNLFQVTEAGKQAACAE